MIIAVSVCFELASQELRNAVEEGLGGFCIPAFREFAVHTQEAGRHLGPRRLNCHPDYFSEEYQTVIHLQHSNGEVALVFILEHLLSKDVCGGVS